MIKIISTGCVFVWFFCVERVVGFWGGFNFLLVLFMSNTLELWFLSRSLLHGFELSHTTVPKFSHEKDEKHTFYTWFAGILLLLIA